MGKYRDGQVVSHGLEAVHVSGVGQLVNCVSCVWCLVGLRLRLKMEGG